MRTCVLLVFCVLFLAKVVVSEDPKTINVAYQDKASTTAGSCSVYVSAPAGSAIGNITVKAETATTFMVFRRARQFLIKSTRFATEVSKLAGDIKASTKATITATIGVGNSTYICSFVHTPTAQCDGNVAHTCNMKFSSVLSAIMAVFALLAIAFL